MQITDIYANQLRFDVSHTTQGDPINIPKELLVSKFKVAYKHIKSGEIFIKTDEVKHIEVTGVDRSVAKLLAQQGHGASALQPLTILLDATPENIDLGNSITTELELNKDTQLTITVSDYYATGTVITNGKYSRLGFDLRATTFSRVPTTVTKPSDSLQKATK